MTATVLFVEDEPLIALTVVEDLSDGGFIVEWAASAEAGLDHLKRARFDVVVTDIRLPGMDGWQLASAAKNIFPDIKIVFVSGYPGRPSQVRHGQFLQKPYTISQLVEAIEVAIKHS